MTKQQKQQFRLILNNIRLAKTQSGLTLLDTLDKIEAQLKNLLPKEVPQSHMRHPGNMRNTLGAGMMYISNRFR